MRCWLFVLVLFLKPLSARAELFPLREHTRQIESKQLALGIDTSTFFGRVGEPRYALVAPTLGAAFRLGEAVLEAAVPFAYLHVDNENSDDQNNVAFGNPWLGIAYLPDCSCGLSRLSFGIAPDLATGTAPLDQTALSLARNSQGNWDGYLWLPGLLPLVLGVSTLLELGILHLGWDADLVFGLPVGERERELGLQNAGDAGLWFGSHVVLGGRVHGTYYPTFAGDNFQSALSAYLRLRFSRDSFGVRYLVNLDGPAGYSFSEQGTWGLSGFFATTL